MSRRILVAIAVAAVLVALGAVGYRSLFHESPDPAAVTPSPSSDAGAPVAVSRAVDAAGARVRVTIRTIDGAVERRVFGSVSWQPVEVGEDLEIDDLVRTGDDGHLTLAIGDAEVTVDPGSAIGVAALQRAVARLRLDDGRVSTVVPAGETQIGIAVGDSDTLAETREGEFSVLSTGDGRATVAATRGEVDVTSAGETIKLAAGTQTRVGADAPPSPPQAIPTSLFLKVRATRKVLRKTSYTVRGKTTPGAIITVNGIRVQVGEDGAFARQVNLHDGKNSVSVDGRDVEGRRERARVELVVDREGPAVGGDVRWGDEPE